MDGSDDLTLAQLDELVRRAKAWVAPRRRLEHIEDPSRHPGSKPPIYKGKARRRNKAARAARRKTR